MFDMNDAEPQKTGELIPDGTFAKVTMSIRPGGIDGQSEIDQALLKAPKDPSSDVRMLDCEFTVAEGPHAKRKFWQMFTVQGGKVDEVRYQIVPDSSRYRLEGGTQDWAAPRDALDELAFLYYLRTVPLEPGKSFTVGRYFQTGYNPIHVRVTGRRPVTMPDGRSVPALAVELTSRNTTMGVRFTDDARRVPVEIDLPLPYGSVSLELSGAS